MPAPDDAAIDAALAELPAIARRMTRTRPHLRDEAESAGLVGLARAVVDFDPDRSPDFAQHARTGMVHAVIDLFHATNPKGYRKSPGAANAPGDWAWPDDGLDLMDPSPPVGWELQAEDAVQAMARLLPARHAAIVRLHYLHAEGAEMAACAAILGVGHNQALHIHRQGLAMLREAKGVAPPAPRPRGAAIDAAIVSGLASLIRDDRAPTIRTVAERSGIPWQTVAERRGRLIAEGAWPEFDGRARRATA